MMLARGLPGERWRSPQAPLKAKEDLLSRMDGNMVRRPRLIRTHAVQPESAWSFDGLVLRNATRQAEIIQVKGL